MYKNTTEKLQKSTHFSSVCHQHELTACLVSGREAMLISFLHEQLPTLVLSAPTQPGSSEVPAHHSTPPHQLRLTHITQHPRNVLLLHLHPGRQCSQPLTCQARPPSTLGWSPQWWGGGPPDGTPACRPGQCRAGPPCPSAR